MRTLLETLAALRLLAPSRGDDLRELIAKGGRPSTLLLALCDGGALEGGLSVALDVRPDELVGPLCARMGGVAKNLKILDVRERPELELTVQFGELVERWEVDSVRALIHNLNDLFRTEERVGQVAVLGEWNDMLQLWTLPKRLLRSVLEEGFFEPENRDQLALVAAG